MIGLGIDTVLDAVQGDASLPLRRLRTSGFLGVGLVGNQQPVRNLVVYFRHDTTSVLGTGLTVDRPSFDC